MTENAAGPDAPPEQGVQKGSRERLARSAVRKVKPPSPGATVRARRQADFVQRWALIGAWIIEIVVFTILVPQSFLSAQNFASMIGSQAVLVILTLGLILPLTTGDYDLSVGGTLSLSAMLIAVLNVQHQWPVGWTVLLAVLLGGGIGALNAGISVGLGIPSLIVTLGVGTVAEGVTLWISDSQTISGISNSLVDAVVGTTVFGIAIEFYYGLFLCVAIWYVYRYTAIGRRMLFTGLGRRVARLSGVSVNRVRFTSLMASGSLAAVAGVLYVGTSGASNPGAGSPLLLPAMAAAFLGTTSIEPGRFNPWGTVIAVYFLSTGINGLALLGISSFVQNLFYGGSLVLAVVLSKLAQRRFVKDEVTD